MSAILVGLPPGSRVRSGLELGRLLAESEKLPLVVCCAIPDRWAPVGPARQVDRDYHAYLEHRARETLLATEDVLGDVEVPVSHHVVTGRSAPAGLLAAVGEYRARVLVAGSSTAGGWGHIALGSVTDRLLHSSPVPVALAPRGLRLPRGARIRRITVAFDGTPASLLVLERAAAVAGDIGATLRLVAFAVHARPMIPPEVGLRAENRVVEVWRAETEELMRRGLAGLGAAGEGAETTVVEGESWREVLDVPEWDATDVLVVGSSPSESLVARVFLGSTATRIVRHTPVSTIVVP